MSFTKQQIEENNERRRVESIALSALTPEERRRHMEAKRAGKKSPNPTVEHMNGGLGLTKYKPLRKPRQFRQPNKTEQRFADILDARKRLLEIQDYRWEGLTIKLADGLRYTPDFAVWVTSDGPRLFIEVKGKKIWDDSIAKFKMAREQNKWAKFEMWEWRDGEFQQLY